MKRDLKADLELCEKATPGPWYAIPHPEYKGACWRIDTKPDAPYENFGQLAYMSGNNARFVVAAREGWPYAIKRAMELEQQVKKDAELRRLVERLWDIHCPWEKITGKKADSYVCVECCLLDLCMLVMSWRLNFMNKEK